MKLTRILSNEEGTIGLLRHGDFECVTIELPWIGNRESISCIPDGTYPLSRFYHRRWGDTYHIAGVPNRSDIIFHPGNWAGSSDAGLRSDSRGCIMPGEYVLMGDPQMMVYSSRRAFSRLMELDLGFDPVLTIRSLFPGPGDHAFKSSSKEVTD